MHVEDDGKGVCEYSVGGRIRSATVNLHDDMKGVEVDDTVRLYYQPQGSNLILVEDPKVSFWGNLIAVIFASIASAFVLVGFVRNMSRQISRISKHTST